MISKEFYGEYNHTVDAKGRVIIPAKFRELLGNEFMVTKGLDGCLFVYDEEEWNAFANKLKALPVNNANARKLVRFFMAGAANVEVDKNGRILLPASLREFAGLEKDVVVAGLNNRVEIWDKERYDMKCTYDDMDEIAEQLSELQSI
ncbi:MAG: division/cell wall cluster transcriptional repressor MraZ [Lachnospiraceae bacterium]|nr:division/cell wall cluster transcriptional repressor MraZ [Lachnospiraceae bacterium]